MSDSFFFWLVILPDRPTDGEDVLCLGCTFGKLEQTQRILECSEAWCLETE